MSKIAELSANLHTRMTGNPDDYYEITLWEDEADCFCNNMDESIAFLQSSCTDEELFWLGEVFDDIMEKTHSIEFLQCLRERVECVQNPEWKAGILEDIRTAAEYIEE